MKELLKRPLHRKIERAFQLKKGVLKKAVSDLKERHKLSDTQVLERSKECSQYCLENEVDYTVAFNFYVSCLNNPKTQIAGPGV
jgi:hypothetical protein